MDSSILWKWKINYYYYGLYFGICFLKLVCYANPNIASVHKNINALSAASNFSVAYSALGCCIPPVSVFPRMSAGEQELVCYWWELTVKGHFVPDRHWDRHLICSLSLPKWSASLPKASLYRRRERRHGDEEGVITWLRSHRKGMVFLPFPSLWSRLVQSSGSLLNPHLKSGFPWVFLSASESLLPE